MQDTLDHSIRPELKGLARTGGWSVVAMLVIMLAQVIIFIIWPPPVTVEGFFSLFDQKPLLGLLSMDLLYLLNNALLVLIYLALYAALQRSAPSAMLIALVLGLMGIAAYYASNTAFEMLSLSRQYAAGLDEIQKAALVGAVGYRSLQLANLVDGQPLGLTGFGASGHLVLQMVRHVYPNSKVYVFTRSEGEQRFARELGAAWAGGTTDQPPERLQAVIDTTPAWLPVIAALEALAPGGRLVINAIRKEGGDRDELLHLNYERHLWMEKEIKSVANVTKGDISEFLALAVEAGIQPEVQTYDLPDAGQALLELKNRKIRGAKVLQIT